MASTRYDAIIAGAGPAGSTAAILLARAGWRVALIEKQPFPRRKVCGECVAASNLPLLDALGIGAALTHAAGPELRRTAFHSGAREAAADLPMAGDAGHPWGRAIAREHLDTLLRDQAIAAGAVLWQPATIEALHWSAGLWDCALQAGNDAPAQRVHTAVLIDAHGSWEALPTAATKQRRPPRGSDLFAFKANFFGAAQPAGLISVLALEGGYGGMVLGDAGVTTLACCIRRDRLRALRTSLPGLAAGDAVQSWLGSQCLQVREALQGATRIGRWLAAGPLEPGIRITPRDTVFRVGNAAGEAHPILGEGISMALQSAALLCSNLLEQPPSVSRNIPGQQARWQVRYAAQWRRAFAPRLRLAATFAHLAMHPQSAGALISAARLWPGLLTQGARLGGKVRAVAMPASIDQPAPALHRFSMPAEALHPLTPNPAGTP